MGHIVWKKNKDIKRPSSRNRKSRFRLGGFYILFKILLATLIPFADVYKRQKYEMTLLENEGAEAE